MTAPIIGPRTMEQLEALLPAADVVLGADVLDRIDEIVPPGVTLNEADAGWQPPPLADASATEAASRLGPFIGRSQWGNTAFSRRPQPGNPVSLALVRQKGS